MKEKGGHSETKVSDYADYFSDSYHTCSAFGRTPMTSVHPLVSVSGWVANKNVNSKW